MPFANKIFYFSVKGWNWGAANFNGSVLNFEVGKHDAFEIPLTYVSHCATAKNEVSLVLLEYRSDKM